MRIKYFSYVGSCSGRNLKIFGAGDWYTTPGSDILWGAVTIITNKSFIYVSVYIFCDLCVIIIQNFYLL